MRANVKSVYSFCKRFDRYIHKTNCRYLTSAELPQSVSSNKSEDPPLKSVRGEVLNGPGLKEFVRSEQRGGSDELSAEKIPYVDTVNFGRGRKVYFDVHGCQMNVNDTEIVWSILKSHNFLKTNDLNDADIVLIVTCAIREGAESKIWNKLENLKGIRNQRFEKKGGNKMKIGILGCMAERLKEKILEKEKTVDLIAGPDSYKDLPRLLAMTENNQTAINVLLSFDETYADILPVRLNENSVTAFV